MQQNRSQQQHAGSRSRNNRNFSGSRGQGQGFRQGQNINSRRNVYGEEYENIPREGRGGNSEYNSPSWDEGQSERGAEWSGSSREGFYGSPSQSGLGGGAYRGEMESSFGREMGGGAYRPGRSTGSYGGEGTRGLYRGGMYGGEVQSGGYAGRESGMQSQRDFSQRWESESQTPYGFQENVSAQMRQASYGKGPKGYKRSDERIKEELCERIAQLSGVDASDVEVQVGEAEVTLSGTVPDRNMKYQLEHAAFDIFGVQDVNNRLKIKRDPVTLPASSSSGNVTGRSSKSSSASSSAPLAGA